MMVIEVHIDPGGSRRARKTVERIYVGNISDLAKVSDYHVWDGVHPHEGAKPTAMVRNHLRADGALALARKVIDRVLQARGCGPLSVAPHPPDDEPHGQHVDDVDDEAGPEQEEEVHASVVAHSS